jgi:hypothetical protein
MIAKITNSDIAGPTATLMQRFAQALRDNKNDVIAAMLEVLGDLASEIRGYALPPVIIPTAVRMPVGMAEFGLRVSQSAANRRKQTGGYIPATTSYLLHKGEVVLPPEVVRSIQDKKTRFPANARSSVAAPVTGGKGKEVHVHLSAGAFMGNPGDARRFAKEVGKYLQSEGAR